MKLATCLPCCLGFGIRQARFWLEIVCAEAGLILLVRPEHLLKVDLLPFKIKLIKLPLIYLRKASYRFALKIIINI